VSSSEEVIWHELECGGYAADLGLWLELAERQEGPVLDIGAGVGRVALALARAGHPVVALDRAPELLEELARRARSLADRQPLRGGGPPQLRTVCADARDFALAERFALCLVPMQTVQLLGGPAGRSAFFRRAAAHLLPGGLVALAIVERLEPFELGAGAPAPESCEREGRLYRSQPTAVRVGPEQFVLERRREVIGRDGERRLQRNVVVLDRVEAATLEAEAARAGLQARGRREIPPTREHVGSTVVMLGA